MVDTIKFSQMTNAGNINNNDIMPSLRSGANVILNNPWTFLPPGTTAQRPVPSSTINYRLRFNTDEQLYEYYDATLGAWTQLQESAFTVGPFVTYTADVSLPDAQNLGALANGILKQTISLGIATLDIAVNDVDFYGPGMTSYLQAPAGVKDVNGNIVLAFSGVPSSANYITVTNSVSGSAVGIGSTGTDTDIGIVLEAKNAGVVVLESANPTIGFRIIQGTLNQHLTNFLFSDTSASRNITFQDANGTLAFLSDIPAGSPSALTKTDDTNVTLTLGGTPATALLQAVSLTLGWTGTLAETRGGTAQSTYILGDTLYASAANTLSKLAGNITAVKQYLSQTGTGAVSAAPLWATIDGGDITGAALTKTDDTNVTMSLGGTPTTALLRATSMTLGWTGQLSVARGGTGLASLTAHNLLIGNDTSALTLLAPSAASGIPLVSQGVSADPAYSTAVVAGGGTGNTTFTAFSLICAGTTATGAFQNVSGLGSANQVLISQGAGALPQWGSVPGLTPAALTKTDDTNVTLTLGGTPATALLQATSLTLGWTGQLALTRGGTNASLTASNGGIFYSTASAGAILSGTATAQQLLMSGASTTPQWSTTTYPLTNAINTMMYASSANVLGVVTPVNSAGLLSSAGGVPGWVAYTGTGAPVLNTNPKIITGFLDTNGNQIIGLNPVASAVNYPVLQNSAIGNAIGLGAAGTDSNILLALNGKGTSGVEIQGTTAGTNANAGYVGEVISSQVLFANAITMTTTATPYNITSIPLTAGDWDVYGNFFVFSAANLMTVISGWIGTSSATIIDNSLTTKYAGAVVTVQAYPVPQRRINVSGNQTVYLSVSADFSGASPIACGQIYARRIR